MSRSIECNLPRWSYFWLFGICPRLPIIVACDAESNRSAVRIVLMTKATHFLAELQNLFSSWDSLFGILLFWPNLEFFLRKIVMVSEVHLPALPARCGGFFMTCKFFFLLTTACIVVMFLVYMITDWFWRGYFVRIQFFYYHFQNYPSRQTVINSCINSIITIFVFTWLLSVSRH